MTMSYGCLPAANTEFAKRWEVTLTRADAVVHFRGDWLGGSRPAIAEMFEDCTAATLYLSSVNPKNLKKIFKMFQEYLSLNGRISAMFTLHIHVEYTPEIIQILRTFAIQGLHVQYSNRLDAQSHHQITGILSVPNPVVQYSYQHWETDPHNEHWDVSIDGRDNVKINEQLGLTFNLGK